MRVDVVDHVQTLAQLVGLVGVFLVAAVGVAPQYGFAETDSGDESIRLLAASSLTGPVSHIVGQFEDETGAEVRVSLGGSSRLAHQIAEGAGADVFLSASREWVEHLVDREAVVPDSRRRFASNRLVWVSPEGHPSGPENLQAVAATPPEALALGNPEVPAGRYARQALRRADLWSTLSDRVVSAENVKRALQWVAMGEADAGIVYASDAAASQQVRRDFVLPDDIQPTIVYQGAVVAEAANPELARKFLEYLTESDAQRILEASGFSPPVSPSQSAPVLQEARGDAVDEASAVGLSLLIGFGCLVAGLIPAVVLGWLLARATFPGKSLVTTLLLAPLALPPVVTGFVLLRLFGRSGLLGPILTPLGIEIPFTTLGAGIAAFVVSFPLYLLTARSAFQLVDRRYEEVSQTLGYPPTRTFWRVTLPLALPGVAAGALLAFARALGEFGATAVLAGNVKGETQTIPLAIYTMLESPDGYGTIGLLVGISVVLSLLAVAGFQWFNRLQRHRTPPR